MVSEDASYAVSVAQYIVNEVVKADQGNDEKGQVAFNILI
jgi:hypothetical protein